MGEFQRHQRIFKPLLLLCISGAQEAKQTFLSFSVLWQDFKHWGWGVGEQPKPKTFSLYPYFSKLSKSFLTEVSQTLLSSNSSLSLKFQPGKLETGQTLIN